MFSSAKSVNSPIVVEIVRPTGKVLRVVERTSYGGTGLGFGHATWSANGRMLAWFDAHGLNVENSDGTDERQLVAYPTACAPQCHVNRPFARLRVVQSDVRAPRARWPRWWCRCRVSW